MRGAAQRLHHELLRRAPTTYAAAQLGSQLLEGWHRDRRPPWRGEMTDIRKVFPRSSSTLFVLGSGTSINEIDDRKWDEVARHDSIGLNFWLLHQFVPTAYTQELASDTSPLDAARADVRRAIVTARATELRGTPILFRAPANRRLTARQGGGRLTPAMARDQVPLPPDQVHLTSDLAVLPIEADAFCRLMTATRALSRGAGRPVRHVPYARSTTIWSLLLALRLGYERVVLCGVDLSDNGYFYEVADAPHLLRRLPIPPSVQKGSVHATNDPTRDGATAEQLIVALDEHLFGPEGRVIEVASERSVLARSLPLHRWG